MPNSICNSSLNAVNCRCCLFEKCYCTKSEAECEYINPNNEQFVADRIVSSIRNSVIYENTGFWRVYDRTFEEENDVARLDTYYIAFINDCLRAIRNMELVYVFKIKHLRDIIRFQGNVKVGYRDGIYYVYLPKKTIKIKRDCEKTI